MKWKSYNESKFGNKVRITCKIEVEADDIEDALDELDRKLLNTDAAVTDGNGYPNPEIVEKYNYWDDENEGDVEFAIYNKPGVFVNVQNAR